MWSKTPPPPPQNIEKHQITRRTDWIEDLRKYAAILVLGALIGSLAVYFSGTKSATETTAAAAKPFEIRTEKGERATVYLPDGSKIVLNACSSLSYPADFGEHTRELTLTGEGYFDVQSNPDLPFIVITSGLNIKAFGTIFNVRAYSDEDTVETTLVEGSVSIETQANRHIISLVPEQVITIPKELIRANRQPDYNSGTASPESVETISADRPQAKEAVLIDNINPEVYTSWIDNKWIVESESLASLVTKIERRYDVDISMEGETVKNYVFSGTLRNLPLEQVLESIRLSAPIKYSINERAVLIREDEQLKKQYEKLIQSN